MAKRKNSTPPTPPTVTDLADKAIQAQNQHLETQEAVYESIAAAQQKGISNQKLLMDVLKKAKKEAGSFADAIKKGVKEMETLNEAAKELDSTGVPLIKEMKDSLVSATKSTKDFRIALFALGAAAGAVAYNLGLIGDKLGTIAKYDKKINPIQEKLDLLENSIRGAFAGQEAAGKFAFQMERLSAAFQKASATALFGKGLGSVGYGGAQLQLAGIGAEKIAEQMKAAGDATGKMPSSKVAADMAVLAARTDQSAEGAASISEVFQRLDGTSADVALNMQEGMRAMADKAGINLGGLMAEVAESSKEMLGYQIKSGSALSRQVAFARSMGVSFQDIAKAGQSMVLNYKDSIKAEMQLSAMLGKNVDLSEVRSKFASGDTDGALMALKAQGLDPKNMDMFQQQQLQEATGMDLTTLSKINSNTGKNVQLGEGNAKKGNQSFLNKTESAARTEDIANANISVKEAAFNISMNAAKDRAVLENEQIRRYKEQIAQLEALKNAEVGLTTALISILTGLATSEIGGFLKELKSNPFGKNDFKKNSAGRMINKKTGKFASAKDLAEGRTGTSMRTKVGGSLLAAGVGAYQGYTNFDKKREGESEVRETDKMGAGLVQGGLSAAGTALGMAFGGPLGGMIGGFLGDSLGGALNEYAPGFAQGVGDMFEGVKNAFGVFQDKLSGLWETLKPIRDLFGQLAQKLGFKEGGMSGILQMVGNFIFDFVIYPFNLLISSISGMAKVFMGIIGLFGSEPQKAWEKIKSGLADFIGGILGPFKNIFAQIWNYIADSKIGKFLNLGKMDVVDPQKVAAEKKVKADAAAKAKAEADAKAGKGAIGVDTKVNKGTNTAGVTTNYGGGGAGTSISTAGSKSITDAIVSTSGKMREVMNLSNKALETLNKTTTQTATNSAASLDQLKTLNTNTLAMKELTRRIEALTRATYEGGGKVVIDGKTLASSVSRYADNTQGTNPNSFTQIFRGETTTYG